MERIILSLLDWLSGFDSVHRLYIETGNNYESGMVSFYCDEKEIEIEFNSNFIILRDGVHETVYLRFEIECLRTHLISFIRK